ncbi:MAG TPA: DUF2786 domain-containing protein [Acidimicrobiales bacterium]|nr:DUF2786 domain-containing protein [Acidimicrobiales bacterium]
MGSQNRSRRAQKLRRRERASTFRSERRLGAVPAREVIYAAVGLLREPVVDSRRYRELLTMLAEGPPSVAVEVDAVVADAFGEALRRNWTAAEVARQTERRLGARHAAYVTDGAGWSGGRAHLGPWAEREGVPLVEAMACAVEVLALLLSLPRLPRLGAAPASARRASRSGQDRRILEKVRALLAKAESTTFPEEAEALSSKAQELMARHSIDEAMVGSGAAARADDAPTGVRVPVDDPYAGAKSMLLSEVASANRCRAVWSKGLGFSTVVGFESDLEFVEVLYTSVLVQATSAMVAAGSRVDRSGRSRTRSFRQAFLTAYATRIGHRLRAAEAASQAAAAEEYGDALLPVLADRSAAVRAAEAEAFPGAVSRSVSISNGEGWAAGSAAADLASLSGRTEVPTGSP